jgi:hypothetical protein
MYMRFGSYVMLMFAIAFAFYMFGQTSAIAYVLGYSDNQSPLDSSGNPVFNNQAIESTSFLSRMGQILSSQSSIQTLLGLGVVAIGAAALTGFSSMYFIPLILLVLLAPYLLMPVGMFMDDPSCSIYSSTGTIGSADAEAIAHNTTRSGMGWSYPSTYNSAQEEFEHCVSISQNGLPYKDVIRLFLNIITILAIISFVRGGV